MNSSVVEIRLTIFLAKSHLQILHYVSWRIYQELGATLAEAVLTELGVKVSLPEITDSHFLCPTYSRRASLSLCEYCGEHSHRVWEQH